MCLKFFFAGYCSLGTMSQLFQWFYAVSYQFPRFEKTHYGLTDRRTDGRTDRRTDRPSYRDAWTHLKKKDNQKWVKIGMFIKLRGLTFSANQLQHLSLYQDVLSLSEIIRASKKPFRSYVHCDWSLLSSWPVLCRTKSSFSLYPAKRCKSAVSIWCRSSLICACLALWLNSVKIVL